MALSKAHTSSTNQNWETPIDFFLMVQEMLGVHFTIDLAASANNSLCKEFYTQEMDSFSLPWKAPEAKDRLIKELFPAACWCKPPYSDEIHPIPDWIYRARDNSDKENFAFLLPINKMDQNWYHEIMPEAQIGMVKGRIQFTINGKIPKRKDPKTGKMVKSGNSQGSVVIALGPAFTPGVFSIPWRDLYKKSGDEKKNEKTISRIDKSIYIV